MFLSLYHCEKILLFKKCGFASLCCTWQAVKNTALMRINTMKLEFMPLTYSYPLINKLSFPLSTSCPDMASNSKTGVWFVRKDTDVMDHFKLHHRWLRGLCFMPQSHLLPYPEAQGSFFTLVKSIDADLLKRLCPTSHQHRLKPQPSVSNLHLSPLYPLFMRSPSRIKTTSNKITKLR